ncbi:glycosyltransferase [Candidatus Bathyarchaeota archaeon]|nr:glycosyltransferase [Candidatus Bathyarchaeota archaeon]
MMFSIIIPAFNEESTIAYCLRRLHQEIGGEDYEIIVVNDGSTDGTAKVVKSFSKDLAIKVIERPVGASGFGHALKAGFDVAHGDYFVIIMADSSEDPADVHTMMRLAKIHEPDAIFGTRFNPRSTVVGYPIIKLVANRFFNILASIFFRIPYSDLSNAFKMYSKEFIRSISIESQNFDITIELPLKALLLEKRILLVANSWHGRKGGYPKWRLVKDGLLYMKRLYSLLRFRYQGLWRKKGD